MKAIFTPAELKRQLAAISGLRMSAIRRIAYAKAAGDMAAARSAESEAAHYESRRWEVITELYSDLHNCIR